MNTFYSLYVKRILDISLALLGLILLSPVLMAIALKLKASGPVFFKQTRIGRHFRPFTLYKFRSMNTKASYKAPPFTTDSDSRITPFGRILRAYKLDELPQLLNVLKGDLSFVGPRPLVEAHIKANKKAFRDILHIRPGITDYASLNYIDEQSLLSQQTNPEVYYQEELMPKKIKLIKAYQQDISFLTDINLIFQTLKAIARRSKPLN